MSDVVSIDAVRRRGRFAMLSLVFALVAAASTAMIGATSFLGGFNPPDWVRVATMAPFPFAATAAIAFAISARRQSTGRGLAAWGLVIALASVAAFVVMIVIGE